MQSNHPKLGKPAGSRLGTCWFRTLPLDWSDNADGNRAAAPSSASIETTDEKVSVLLIISTWAFPMELLTIRLLRMQSKLILVIGVRIRNIIAYYVMICWRALILHSSTFSRRERLFSSDSSNTSKSPLHSSQGHLVCCVVLVRGILLYELGSLFAFCKPVRIDARWDPKRQLDGIYRDANRS